MSSFKLNALHQLSSKSSGEYFSIHSFLEEISKRSRVQCLVASTYRLHLPWVEEQFRSLLSQDIPMLVLHGSRNHRTKATSASLVVEEVVPRLPRKKQQLSRGIDPEGDGDVDEQIKSIPGVHHAKYILVFVPDGLWIAITTANLTPHSAVDGTWHQFFPLREKSQRRHRITKATHSDFGEVLEDFITHQTQQMRSNSRGSEFSILDWIRSFVGPVSLSSSYDFDAAEVALVSSVPGRFVFSEGTPSSTFDHCIACAAESKSTRTSKVKYGLQRMRDLIECMELKSTSPEDRLYIQPTSIGAISQAYMSSVLEQLMPESYWDHHHSFQLRQENYRILWPTSEYMRGCIGDQDEFVDHNDELGGLFLDPGSLATMEPDIHSQMYTYRASLKFRGVSPHIKTYIRILKGWRNGVSRRCTCDALLWCLLSSACLSTGKSSSSSTHSTRVGAQGRRLSVNSKCKAGNFKCKGVDQVCFHFSLF